VDDGSVGVDQRRFTRLLSRHRLLIAVCLVLGLIAGLGLALSSGKTFVATSELRVDNPLTLSDVLATSSSNRTTVTVPDQISVLKSDAVKARADQALNGRTKYSTSFAPEANGDVVSVSATASNKALAHDAAAAYTNAYLDILAARNRPLFDDAVKQLTSSITDANNQVAILNQTLASATSSSTLDAVRAQVSTNQTQLLQRRTDLQRQLDQVQLSRSVSPSGDAAIVSEPSTVSSSGPIKTMLIGGVLGLLIGLALAGFQEGRSGRIADASDVQEAGIPVVARVKSGLPRRMRTASAALSPGDDVGAYRGAAVVLAPPHSTEIARRWLVTTPESDGAAAAVLSGRLGRQVARLGRRVVLVDCDGEQGSGKGRAGHGEPLGLAEVLSGDLDVERALRVDPSSGVTLLTAGRGLATLSEPLASPGFARLVDGLAERFDVVIVTGVPVGRSADAELVAPLVDLVVLAVQSGVTRRKSLVDAVGRLDGVVRDASVVAVLLGGGSAGPAGGGTARGQEALEPARQRRRAPAVGGLSLQRSVRLNPNEA
jgi:Mrp family chromosome partitioning ATPase